jgi:hypothetical protein
MSKDGLSSSSLHYVCFGCLQHKPTDVMRCPNLTLSSVYGYDEGILKSVHSH